MDDFLSKFEKDIGSRKKSNNDYIYTSFEPVKTALKCPGFASKRFFLINSNGNASSLCFSLQALKDAQREGFCVVVDSEYLCEPKMLSEQFNIELNELLYLQPTKQDEMFEILLKLLEYKELRLICVNSITSFFPVTINIKELTNNLIKLQNSLKRSNCSIFVVNPYYNLSYNILSEYFDVIININRKKGQFYGEIEKNNVNFVRNTFIL